MRNHSSVVRDRKFNVVALIKYVSSVAAISWLVCWLVGYFLVGTAALAQSQTEQAQTALTFLGRYATNQFDASAAEVAAFDPVTKRLFVVNGHSRSIDVLDISNPTQPNRIASLNVAELGVAANSVAVDNGVVAVAVEAAPKTANGQVGFYSATSLELLHSVTVGALPDMLTFSPDGRYVVVANEGEPNESYQIDPEGSVSVINISPGISTGVTSAVVATASFARFNDDIDVLRSNDIRIFGPNASVAQDLEPEYIAISADSQTAWVVLQENNALAIIDIPTAEVKAIQSLGYQPHDQQGFELDASDKDDRINIRSWPVQGMFQPDAIVRFEVAGETYLIMANEGEARDYKGFSEETRVGKLRLDESVFTDEGLQNSSQLGRLQVTTMQGEVAGKYRQLYSFGSRSFSIRKANGELVWDSGSQIAQIIAARQPKHFNASHDSNRAEKRSDNKGAEPESVAIYQASSSRILAFIGLERFGGILTYDVSKPAAPQFVDFQLDRDFTADPESELSQAGDLGPEGLLVIDPSDSPNGKALLVVCNEVSGTVTLYQINALLD